MMIRHISIAMLALLFTACSTTRTLDTPDRKGVAAGVTVESHQEYDIGNVEENPNFVEFNPDQLCLVGEDICNRDYHPKTVGKPTYPRSAALKLKESTCFAMFSVSKEGDISKINLIECDLNDKRFIKAVNQSLENTTYFPRVVNGVPEPVPVAVAKYTFYIKSVIK